VVKLESYIRQSVKFDIELHNPSEDELTIFTVDIEGKDLTGEDQISVKAKETVKYTLNFAPLKIFKSKGSITFINEKLGELWYELNLISKEARLVKIPKLEA
jgi:hypothetical protein